MLEVLRYDYFNLDSTDDTVNLFAHQICGTVGFIDLYECTKGEYMVMFLGANRVLGDILCLAGSTLYAIGNVGEEYLVKQNSRVEYLGMIGLFGSIISGIQL